MRFSKEFIEQVRAGNDIADVVGGYVVLQKKQGNKYWACCPFHDERTPSFSVSPDKGFYYCFGCHEGGDVFRFVQQCEHCSFTEAVEKLAARIGLAVSQEDLSPEEKRREAEKQRLYEICELATAYFHNCLTKTKMGAAGLAYWKQRGVSAPTITGFKLGYAPPEWDRLYRDFTRRGYGVKELVKSGLCIEKKGKVYDRFRDRCMFPIRDIRGRTVAFGGRILAAGEPKYLNSPETPIFSKSRILFAMDKALPAIHKSETVVLVEGYMDVVGLHNLGVTNVVASLGTAFTEEQARLLRRSAKEAIVAYDMDRAGRAATERVIEIARRAGLRLRIATLPEGKDPDEYVLHHGARAWENVISGAQRVLDYRLDEVVRQHDVTTIDGKNAVLETMVPLILATDNLVAVDSYLTALATRLRLDEGVVRSAARRYGAKEKREVYIAPASTQTQSARGAASSRSERAERHALMYLMSKDADSALAAEFTQEDFTVPFYRKLWGLLSEKGAEEITPAWGITKGLEEKESAQLAGLLLAELPATGDARAAYLVPLRRAALQRRYDRHRVRAAALDKEGNSAGFQAEMQAAVAVFSELKKWS